MGLGGLIGGIFGGGGGGSTSVSNQTKVDVEVGVNPNINVLNVVDLQPVEQLVGALTDQQQRSQALDVASLVVQERAAEARQEQTAGLLDRLTKTTILAGLGFAVFMMTRKGAS